MPRVLFVEDDVPFARLFQRLYPEVTFVLTPSIERARASLSSRFDGYIVDVRLPDGNGLDLIDEILAEDPRAEILVLTADPAADPAAVRRASEVSCIATKPLYQRAAARFLARCATVQPRASLDEVIARVAPELSATPREVLRLAVAGCAPGDIRRRLGIASSTYSKHVRAIKLASATRSLAAAALAVWRQREVGGDLPQGAPRMPPLTRNGS